jgi:hypothetical protein
MGNNELAVLSRSLGSAPKNCSVAVKHRRHPSMPKSGVHNGNEGTALTLTIGSSRCRLSSQV